MSDDSEASADRKRATLFLSYAHPDRVRATKLAGALGAAGFEVWWDALIEGGAQFATTIDEALAKADAVLVLWSRHSVDSAWVRDEAATGRDRHRLIPLSLDGCEPPLGFRQYQTIKLKGWRGQTDAPEIQAIVRALDALGHRAAPASAPGLSMSRRRVVAGGAAVGALLAGGGAWWAVKHGAFAGDEDGAGIAVLPFRNLSADADQAYFAAGLTEEVRAALRRIASLKVVAAASSEAASEGKDDAPTIARKLGVSYLLEGSVQHASDMVRIAVDLTDGVSGFSKWSKSVDRPLTDIFAVENEIASLVAGAMLARMVTAAPPLGGTTDVAAYEHFLRGRALFNLGKDEPTDRAALAEIDRAVTIDPRFALAHAARSRSIAAIAVEYASADALQPLYDDSIRAAQRAIELAPDLAEAQLAMAFVLFTCRLEVAKARPYYDRAFALAHGNADIILLFALYCSRAGRAGDAATAIAQALTLDPLNPRTHRAAGSIDYAARRYRAAIPHVRRALQLNATLSNAHALIGACLMQLGDNQAANAEFTAEPHATFRLAGLAIVQHRLGKSAEARRYFAQLLSEAGDSGLYQQAEVLAQWGNGAGAIAAIERARAIGDSGLIYIATDPMLDPIRTNPKFARIVKEMGFG